MKKSLVCFFALLSALAAGCDKDDSPERVDFREYEITGISHSDLKAVVSRGGVLYDGQVCKVTSADMLRELFPSATLPSVDFRQEVLLLAAGGYRNLNPKLTPAVYRNSDGSLILHVKIEDRIVELPMVSIWLVAVSIDSSLAGEPVELQVEELGYTGD